MDAPNRVEGVRVSAHEGGHNFGLQHSSSRDFGTETLGSPGVQGSLSEYGDNYSVMGSSSGHYTMTQKVQLGWADLDTGTHQVQTVLSSGTFTIKPAEDTVGGLKALKVKRGTDTSNNNWLYVSYRQNGGDYDTTSSSAGHNNAALIHYEDNITRSSGKTHLIDFTTSNGWSDVALASGQSWSDTYSNLSITVGAATPTSLDVTINYGPIPCNEFAPTLSLAPASQSAFAGGSAATTATVTNNDNSGCSAGTFTLTPTVPAGWGYSVSPVSLVLSSGQTDSATFTVNPPVGTSPATYSVSLAADHPNGTLSGSDSASVHVVTPLTDIAITSVNGLANAEVGSTVNVTVENVGNQDVASNIDITLVDTTDGPTIGTQTIADGLAPGASTTLTFPWNTGGASSPADHTLTASHNFSDENGSNNSGSTVVTVNDPLSVDAFSPPVVLRGDTEPVSISGEGFLAGATVQFVNGAGPSPSAASVVVVDPYTITASVSVPSGGGKNDRQWDAQVDNPGGASATLAGALTVSSNPSSNAGPTVSISSPANGSSFSEGTNVSFTGSASDTEDGDLTEDLTWNSNIDGGIGSSGNPSFVLSPGIHTITASVTDSGGKSGSETVSITVTGSGGIVLGANGYKVQGKHTIDLSWTGASGGLVEIHRDGSLLTTTANDGAYTDATNNRGGGRTYVYQLCETDGGACSNTATVNF